MKVLLIATVQSHICQFHKPLVNMLRKSGNIEIHVAAHNNLAEKNGLVLDFADKVFDVPFERSPFSYKNIRAYFILKKIIREGNYDVIHCNTPVGGILGRLAGSKERKKGTKVYYTAHGFHFYQNAPKKNWLIYYPIEKYFAKKTDKLITINEEDYAFAKSKFSCKVEHIHGAGVDSDRYRCGNEAEVREIKNSLGLSGKNILCVGELLSNKNQTMAIKAMTEVVRMFPDAHLLLAGNGPEKDNLISLVNELGLQKKVRLLGYCTNLEMYQRVCDLSVSCSIREGLGLNIIEAMLSKTPVVATKNRGHNELFKMNKKRLVDINDIDTLSKNIIDILGDRESAQRQAEENYNFALSYSFDSVEKELKVIYYE